MGDYAVVVGSLNIDLVIRGERMPSKGESVLGTEFNIYPGGKGANQAVQLARLGIETYMIGRVGNDLFADQLIGSLEDANIQTDYVIRDSTMGTGKGCVFIDGAGNNWIVVIPEANMNWQQSELEPIWGLIDGASVLLAQLEIPVNIVEAVINRAAQADVKTILNTAPAFAVPDQLIQQVDVLIMNETEAAFYVGQTVNSPKTAIGAAQALRQKGARVVIVTLGAQGAVTIDATSVIQTPAYDVPVVDVTAAGDSFCASVAYGLTAFDRLDRILRFACASGALCVTQQGAQPALPDLIDIHDFLGRRGIINDEKNNL